MSFIVQEYTMQQHAVRSATLLALFTILTHHVFPQDVVKFKNKRGEMIRTIVDKKSKGVQFLPYFGEHVKDYGLSKEKLNKDVVESLGRKIVDDYKGVLKIASKDLKKGSVSKSVGMKVGA